MVSVDKLTVKGEIKIEEVSVGVVSLKKRYVRR